MGYQWDGIKTLKAKFRPKFTKFKDTSGKHIPSHEYANEAAKYLSTAQWASIGEEDEGVSLSKCTPHRCRMDDIDSKKLDLTGPNLTFV